jgi:hypothetical protein
MILLISASQVARITGLSHHAQPEFLHIASVDMVAFPCMAGKVKVFNQGLCRKKSTTELLVAILSVHPLNGAMWLSASASSLVDWTKVHLPRALL